MKSNKEIDCERKSKSIKEEVLKKIVVESVNKKIQSIINNKKLEEITVLEYKKSTTSVIDREIELIDQKISKLDRAINLLYEDYTNDLIEEEDYRRFYKGNFKRINALKL